ncbi:MAG: hypothetical protein MI919_19275, partial [Holophagales bacterium]|nr:hypothetical protein [Holophagales bacterium]
MGSKLGKRMQRGKPGEALGWPTLRRALARRRRGPQDLAHEPSPGDKNVLPALLARGRRLGHWIGRLPQPGCEVRRDAVRPPPPEAAEAADTAVLRQLDAAIAASGLSAAAGERVSAALTSSPEAFREASGIQLSAYASALLGAGDLGLVESLVEAAPVELGQAVREHARKVRWFQWDLERWALRGIRGAGAEAAADQVESLWQKAYWRDGTVPAWASLEDRLRLARAAESSLDRNRSTGPRSEVQKMDRLLAQLRASARPGETALAGGDGAPASGQSSPLARLPAYQRALVTHVRVHLAPGLDVSDPDAYAKARRLAWYRDRPAVLRSMGQEAGLSSDQLALVGESIDGLSESQRLRFVTWLLGSGEENDKLDVLRGYRKARKENGRIRGVSIDGWLRSIGQAMDEGSVYAHSFEAAFLMGAPPAVGSIDDLPDLLAVLDHWDVSARAYVETVIGHRQAQIELEEQKQAQGESLGPGIAEGYRQSLAKWQAGGPQYVRTFLREVARVRLEARRAQRQLSGLRAQDADTEPDPKAVGAATSSARGMLEGAAVTLGRLAPEGQRFAESVYEQRRLRSRAMAEQIGRMAKQPWWQKGLEGAWKAADRFAARLKDPGTWQTALEIGLELAGAAVSGGASVVLKLVKWLATTGMELKGTITGVMSKLGQIFAGGGLSKMLPLGSIFSASRLISAVLGALFGDVPPKPSIGSGETEVAAGDGSSKASSKKRGRGPAAKLIAKVSGLYELLRSKAAGVVDATWAAFDRVDLSRSPIFVRFAILYARAKESGGFGAAARKKALEFVDLLKGKLGGFLGGVLEKLRWIQQIFTKPGQILGTWLQGLVGAGIEHLIRILITNPPSAILKTTFKAAASLLGTDPGEIAAKIKAALSGVPLIGEMMAKIESTVATSVSSVVEEKAGPLLRAGSDLVEEQAVTPVRSLGKQVEGTFADAGAAVDQITGGLFRAPVPAEPQREAEPKQRLQGKRSGRLPAISIPAASVPAPSGPEPPERGLEAGIRRALSPRPRPPAPSSKVPEVGSAGGSSGAAAARSARRILGEPLAGVVRTSSSEEGQKAGGILDWIRKLLPKKMDEMAKKQ